MLIELNAFTGEVKSGINNTIIQSNAIGSCVVVVAFDKYIKAGAIAHTMLCGSAPNKDNVDVLKYCDNAIEELLNQLVQLGSNKSNIETCIVGGRNVLQRQGDKIGADNIKSVENYLKQKHIKIKQKALGGILRRSAYLNVEQGQVYITEGDSKPFLLYDFYSPIII
ncbi:MAG: hypothetical protein PHW82_07155 [Bacteroidales bacterium]|nr:hypothetical protein [Bacteroidales bacterium]